MSSGSGAITAQSYTCLSSSVTCQRASVHSQPIALFSVLGSDWVLVVVVVDEVVVVVWSGSSL